MINSLVVNETALAVGHPSEAGQSRGHTGGCERGYETEETTAKDREEEASAGALKGEFC